jgi:hypothetical protein
LRKKAIVFFNIIVALFLISSCKGNPSKKPNAYEKKDKAPQSLNSILENVNSILKDVEEVKKVAIKPELSDEDKEKDSKNKTDEKKTSKEKEIQKLWDSMNKSINDIHKYWNVYEIEGAKKGITADSTFKFEESINSLTLAIENRDSFNILNSGSEVYKNLSSFFDLYKDEIKGDISKIKYCVYKAYLIAEKGEIDASKEVLTEAENYINNMRIKLTKDKEKSKNVDKISFSIQDMKEVLKLNNSNLLKIKRDIVLKNLETLEK